MLLHIYLYAINIIILIIYIINIISNQITFCQTVLCIYVKLPGETSYRAVYLNHLTVQDLISKLSDKLDFSNQQIADVIRYSKSRNLTVRVDDEYINQIEDEQDMEVEVQIGQDGSMMILTLKY